MIQSKNYENQVCVLVDQRLGKMLSNGDIVKTFRGEYLRLTGGRAPHKPSSEGKAWVQEPGRTTATECFASVIGAEWVILDDLMIAPKREGK